MTDGIFSLNSFQFAISSISKFVKSSTAVIQVRVLHCTNANAESGKLFPLDVKVEFVIVVDTNTKSLEQRKLNPN